LLAACAATLASVPTHAQIKDTRLVMRGSGGVEPDGMTELHRAVLAGNVRLVKRLVQRRADVRAVTRYGITPVSLAILGGHVEIVDTLLGAGVDPNSTTGEGETALMAAARAGHVPIVERLLARGANANATEQWRGQTALMLAAAEGHSQVVARLLKGGAEANAVSNTLDYWSMVPSEPATPKIVMARGGMTALHYASRQGSRGAIAVLAAAPGIDVNLADPDGVTPLLYATLNGHFDAAADLLLAGADPNAADAFGRTVLFSAIQMNRPDREPRPPVRRDDSTTPLKLAALALSKGARVDSVITGRIPNRCTQGCQAAAIEGATPLWRAARAGDVTAVRLLLEAGADPAVAARDGSTAAMMAAGISWRDDRGIASQDESIEVLKLLLARGVNVNSVNAAGETALHGAAGRGAAAVIGFLVESGADLRAKDKTNRIPIHVAMGISDQLLRVGGGVAVEMPVRHDAVRALETLMYEKSIVFEPYTREAAAATPSRKEY
jgi:ankyrin repeat protein